MIVCHQSQLTDARVEHPDAPILCRDTRNVHLPGGRSLRIAPARMREALRSPKVSEYKPGRSG